MYISGALEIHNSRSRNRSQERMIQGPLKETDGLAIQVFRELAWGLGGEDAIFGGLGQSALSYQ